MTGSQPRSGLMVSAYCVGDGRGVSLADVRFLSILALPTLATGHLEIFELFTTCSLRRELVSLRTQTYFRPSLVSV